LSAEEREEVLRAVNSERFCDQAPAEVYATLLDEGRYLCSERTLYRILEENHQVKERRDQLRHPRYAAPELLASRPNEVWSWDITKLLGPAKWTYFYLYVILEFFPWYNQEHHHSGLGYLTPFEVHFGEAEKHRDRRALVLRGAFERHPERFVRGLPRPPELPTQVWINKPQEPAPRAGAEALGVVSQPVQAFSQKNGFHRSPITDDRQSVRDLPRVKIQ